MSCVSGKRVRLEAAEDHGSRRKVEKQDADALCFPLSTLHFCTIASPAMGTDSLTTPELKSN